MILKIKRGHIIEIVQCEGMFFEFEDNPKDIDLGAWLSIYNDKMGLSYRGPLSIGTEVEMFTDEGTVLFNETVKPK